jgi:hypothetical protein
MSQEDNNTTPVWIHLLEAAKTVGLCRSRFYELLDHAGPDKIKTVLIQQPNGKRGSRMIHRESLLQYFDKLADNQQGMKATGKTMKREEKEAVQGVNPDLETARPNGEESTTAGNDIQGISDWPGDDEHPYYAIQEMLDNALCMAATGSRRRSLKNYITRVATLIPYIERLVPSAPRGRLAHVIGLLTLSNDDICDTVKAAQDMVATIIVADEDAKFPGCRTAEGELKIWEDDAKDGINT